MKTPKTLLLGLAGLGFVLAMPAHAGSALAETSASLVPGLVLAARDSADARQEQRREVKEEERRASRNQQNRDAERPYTQQEYGYGYERRQQFPPTRDEGRHRH